MLPLGCLAVHLLLRGGMAAMPWPWHTRVFCHLLTLCIPSQGHGLPDSLRNPWCHPLKWSDAYAGHVRIGLFVVRQGRPKFLNEHE
jgi:hypothetical protein